MSLTLKLGILYIAAVFAVLLIAAPRVTGRELAGIALVLVLAGGLIRSVLRNLETPGQPRS